MKNTYLLLFVIGLGAALNSCSAKGDAQHQNTEPLSDEVNSLEPQEDSEEDEEAPAAFSESDLLEVETLIRNAYLWSDATDRNVDMIMDADETKYIGYDLENFESSIEALNKSSLFTEEFINNFKIIHLAVHEKLGSGEIEWKQGQLPNFGSGADPWCNCQDVPFDEPSPWSLIEIETITVSNNSGEFHWKWGGIKANAGSGWNSFRYGFTVKKIDDQWKIDSLEGLNLEDFTRKYF